MENKNTHQTESAKLDVAQTADSPMELVNDSRRRFGKTGLAASGVLLTLASRSALGAGALSPSGFISGNVSQQGATTSSLGSSITVLQNTTGAWSGIKPSEDFATVFGRLSDKEKFGCYVKYKTVKNNKYTYQLGSGNGSKFVKYTLLDVLNQKHVGYYPVSGSPLTGDSEIDKSYNNTCYKPQLDTTKCSKDKSYRALSLDGYAISDLGQHCVAALINSRAGKTPYLPESTIKEMFNKCSSGQAFNPTVGVDWYVNDCIKYLKTTWSA